MYIYEVEKITDSLYSIREDITYGQFPILIYLVIGEKRAALIDTGLGTGNLRKVVNEITRLPITVLHTHGHGDHLGADTLFNDIYLNRRDYRLVGDNDSYSSEQQRLSFLKFHLKDKPDLYEKIKWHMVKYRRAHYKNIDDGDTIDLGGIKLEAVSTPGHTSGCISYINKRDGYAFTGDGIADIHWFDEEKSITVQEFLSTLEHFQKRAENVENIYAAHIPKPFTLKLVQDLYIAAEAIINGAQDEMENADYQFLVHGNLYVHREGDAAIYYKKEKIYSKAVVCSSNTLSFCHFKD